MGIPIALKWSNMEGMQLEIKPVQTDVYKCHQL